MEYDLKSTLLQGVTEFLDIWHGLIVPTDADLLKDLDNGALIVPFLLALLMRGIQRA